MREFGTDYLYKITVEPIRGYNSFEKRKKPYYVVARNKDHAKTMVNLKAGWKVRSVLLLAAQYSSCLFGSN